MKAIALLWAVAIVAVSVAVLGWYLILTGALH